MKVMNYMGLNQNPVQLSFYQDRTLEFEEIYHAHQGMEWLYIHKGRGQVVVDRQIYELGPGSFFLFRPFQLHRVRLTIAAGESYVRSLFVFEPAVLDEALFAFPVLQSYLRTLLRDYAGLPCFQGDGSLEKLVASYGDSVGNGQRMMETEDRLVFLTALLRHIRGAALERLKFPAAASSTVVQSTAAEQMMDWIEEHYASPFELKRLAEAVHLTPNHVSSLFRKAVGSSITEYITARRIRQACWLLRTTDMPMREVGEQAGYPDFSYFCQTFKRHVGVSPKQYKKERMDE